MTKTPPSPQSGTSIIPANVKAFLSKPPVLPSELPLFSTARDEMAHALGANDYYEWRLCEDFALTTVEHTRILRAKLGLMQATYHEALIKAFSKAFSDESEETIFKFIMEWYGSEDGKSRILRRMEKPGVSEEIIEAEALLSRLPDLEALSRLAQSKIAARATLTREFDAHRERKRKNNQFKEDVIDAEFDDVENSKEAASI